MRPSKRCCEKSSCPRCRPAADAGSRIGGRRPEPSSRLPTDPPGAPSLSGSAERSAPSGGRRARARGVTHGRGTPPGLGFLEIPPLPAPQSGDGDSDGDCRGKSQTAAAPLPRRRPPLTPATQKTPACPCQTATHRARWSRHLLVNGLHQRRAPRWPPLSHLQCHRRFSPRRPRPRSRLFLARRTRSTGTRPIRVLDQLVQRHGKPQRLRCDNGPEFIADKLQRFCTRNTIDLAWIEPGKPTQNAYIERFNGSYRRELLDAYIFPTLQPASSASSGAKTTTPSGHTKASETSPQCSF